MTGVSQAGEPHHAEVKRRYGFDGWPGRDGRTTAGPFLPDHTSLAGLTLDRRVPFPGTRQAFIDHLNTGNGARVALWIRRCDTVLAAHEALVEVLATSMAPRLPSCAERGVGPIGDVAFCGVTDPVSAIYFTRGNVLVRVENIGPHPTPVASTAAEIDRQIRTTQREPESEAT
ncbi:MAG: hypothetical protein ACJ786_11420 [Catenulispora sp.]